MAPSSRRAKQRDPRAFVVDSLAARAQSVAEIERKLAARQVPEEEARAAVLEAVRLGYLDDRELARQVARGSREGGYGRRRAAQTLRRRGVPDALAQAALDEAYGAADEVALAGDALGARPIRDDADRRRAVARLVRRGFTPAVAWQVVRLRPPADPGHVSQR